MKLILDLLRRPAPAAADIRAALAALPHAEADAAVASLTAERRRMLLDGETGPDMDQAERRLAEALRERDRNTAFREELTASLAEAEARERAAALQATRDAAEAEAAAAARVLNDGYDLALAEMATMLGRLDKAEAGVAAANAALRAAGLPGTVPDVASRLRLRHPLHHGERLRQSIADHNLRP